MLILPAIDIRRGVCVRLYQGRPEQETIYSDDPIEMADRWKKKGAQMLHVVDLDGAFEGNPVNLTLIGKMRRAIDLPIEVGGGFRNLESIRMAIDLGIDRVILGSAAIYSPKLVEEAVHAYKSAVAVSIDVSGAFATAAGWKIISTIPFPELAAQMRNIGLQELLFTDTTRDGTLLGPNIANIRQYLEAAQLPVIISGGITSLEDIFNLKQLESKGLKGVVIGKALYDQKIALEDALRIA